MITDERVTLINGSAHSLPQIADESVHCIVTSPPYMGLRSYDGEQGVEWPTVEYSPLPGMPPITIHGCDPDCDHEWGDEMTKYQRGKVGDNSTLNGPQDTGGRVENVTQGAHCQKCGGWRGPLGLEPTLEAYIGHLILCLREWRRILHPSGTLWVNLGDSYNGSGGAGGDYNAGGLKEGQPRYPGRNESALKPKDLMMAPARFALAAQADGWWLRSDILWSKPNPMPESVTDRPTKAHEYIFLLTKSQRYFYDSDAIREPHKKESLKRYEYGLHSVYANAADYGGKQNNNQSNCERMGDYMNYSGRNRRTVWHISTKPFPGSHFAVFPPEIPELCIKAGTSERGCCPACDAPWERVTEKGLPSATSVRPQSRRAVQLFHESGLSQDHLDAIRSVGCADVGKAQQTMTGFGNNTPEVQKLADEAKKALGGYYREFLSGETLTTGWQPTCNCPAASFRPSVEVSTGDGERYWAPAPIPAVVLDPFSGSGTTLRVALALGRHAIGVDISETYLTDLTPDRIGDVLDELRGELKAIEGDESDWSDAPLFALGDAA